MGALGISPDASTEHPMEKIDMEDMCQLTLHPTEYKYRSSYEQIAKVIAAHSSTPKLCLVNFMQLILFCYLTGNNDMHLKTFRCMHPKAIICSLLPTIC